MKYLFFDIECANCHEHTGKIFSFGYVLVDETLTQIIEKDDLVVNPDTEFDWFVRKNMMGYSMKHVLSQKKFPSIYKKIKSLIEDKDTMAIGFEVQSDVSYLLDECQRYELEPFNFKYADIRKIVWFITREKVNSLGTEYMKWCGKLPSSAHRSDADALYTLEIARAICRQKKASFEELLNEYEQSVGEAYDYFMGFKGQPETDHRNKSNSSGNFRELNENQQDWLLKGSKNFGMFIRFLDYVQKNDEKMPQVFAGKKVCLSLNYSMYHFKNMVKLVQLITNAGGEYCKKASESDVFTTYDLVLDDGSIRNCSMLEAVKEAITDGKRIETITFDELLDKLGLSEEMLDSMEDVDLTYHKDEKFKKIKTE